jgi:hypothetical protein
MQDSADISLVRIDNERELVKNGVDELSKEIWGKPAPRRFPIYLVYRERHCVGFFQALQQTCIYPALHPQFMPIREFISMVKSLATETKRMTGDPLFMLCNKAEELGDAKMKLMRLQKAQETAYVYTEEEGY